MSPWRSQRAFLPSSKRVDVVLPNRWFCCRRPRRSIARSGCTTTVAGRQAGEPDRDHPAASPAQCWYRLQLSPRAQPDGPLPELFAKMKPYLYCVNLNGMQTGGPPRVMPIGQGDREQAMIKIVPRQQLPRTSRHSRRENGRRYGDRAKGKPRWAPADSGSPRSAAVGQTGPWPKRSRVLAPVFHIDRAFSSTVWDQTCSKWPR